MHIKMYKSRKSEICRWTNETCVSLYNLSLIEKKPPSLLNVCYCMCRIAQFWKLTICDVTKSKDQAHTRRQVFALPFWERLVFMHAQNMWGCKQWTKLHIPVVHWLLFNDVNIGTMWDLNTNFFATIFSDALTRSAEHAVQLCWSHLKSWLSFATVTH